LRNAEQFVTEAWDLMRMGVGKNEIIKINILQIQEELDLKEKKPHSLEL